MEQVHNPDSGPPWDPAAVEENAGPAAAPAAPNEVADEVVDAAKPGVGLALLQPLQKVEADVDTFLAEIKGTAIDLSTTAGDKAARKVRLSLVALRTAADTAYETGNAPFLAAQRDARAFRDRIKGKVQAVEDGIDKAIREADAAAETRRLARIEAERVRREGLRERITQMAAIARRAIGKPSADIEQKITLLVAVPVGDDFAEFKAEAEAVHAESLAQLREMLDAAKKSEAEAARLVLERAELNRQREAQEAAAQAERDRQAATARAEEERQAAARAEIERQEEQARAAREAADRQAQAERAEADRQAAEQRAAEQAAIDAQRAQLEADRAEQERRDREAQEARERDEELARQEEQRRAEEARAAEEARQAQERAARAAQEAADAARLSRLHAGAQALLEAAVVGVEALKLAAQHIRTLAGVHGATSTAADETEQAADTLRAAVAVAGGDGPAGEAVPVPKPRRAPRARPAPGIASEAQP